MYRITILAIRISEFRAKGPNTKLAKERVFLKITEHAHNKVQLTDKNTVWNYSIPLIVLP